MAGGLTDELKAEVALSIWESKWLRRSVKTYSNPIFFGLNASVWYGGG